MKLCVIDVESSGLYPEAGHEIWEIGLIVRDDMDGVLAEAEYLWRVKPNLSRADPQSLRVGRFYERTDGMVIDPVDHAENLVGEHIDAVWSNPVEVASVLAFHLDNSIVIGANPGFDKDFIQPFLRQHGQAYTAHYRPICVTTLAAGFLFGKAVATSDIASGRVDLAFVPEAVGLPWSSNAISAEVGVNAQDYDRHSALGDCRFALAQFDSVTGGGRNG